MKAYVSHRGYRKIGLTVNGKTYQYFIHRLLAETFIPNPENKPQVNHLDGDKLNNNLENLEWCTAKENIAHAFSSGLKKGKVGCNSKLSVTEVRDIVKMLDSGCTTKFIADHFRVSKETIRGIKNGFNWSSVTGIKPYQSEVSKLKKENAKLRECVEFYASDYSWHERIIDSGEYTMIIHTDVTHRCYKGLFCRD
jgi:hypothetical protein